MSGASHAPRGVCGELIEGGRNVRTDRPSPAAVPGNGRRGGVARRDRFRAGAVRQDTRGGRQAAIASHVRVDQADRCRRPERWIRGGRSGRRSRRHPPARLALRHPQLCRRRSRIGIGGLPGGDPVSARIWHDALSLQQDIPECSTGGGRSRRHRLDGRFEAEERDRRRLRLGGPDRRDRRDALAGTLQGTRGRERLFDHQPDGKPAAVAAVGRIGVVVSVLLLDGARRDRVREIPPRLQQAHLEERFAEMGLRRSHLRSDSRVLRQSGSRRHRAPQLPLAAEPGQGRVEVRRPGRETCRCSRHHRPDDHHRQRFRRHGSGWKSLCQQVRRQVCPSDPRRDRTQRASRSSGCLCQGRGRRRWIHHMSLLAALLTAALALPVEGELPSLGGATGWLNSQPLTAADLRGKVVLVDFWTYTCINWLRTLGYVRAWAEKYSDQGLVVVGVHTPEFPFEADVDNVRTAAADMNVSYPIALDSDYAVWDAFSNHYWPAIYIADAEGRIRFEHFGEGQYEECERVIQRLLRDAGADGIDEELVSVADQGFEAQADWANLGSPETYLGYAQAQTSPA